MAFQGIPDCRADLMASTTRRSALERSAIACRISWCDAPGTGVFLPVLSGCANVPPLLDVALAVRIAPDRDHGAILSQAQRME